MISRSRISAVLLVLGIALLIAPALVPVQSVLYHEAEGPLLTEKATFEDRGVDVVTYENLSDRGKELYEQTLRNGGSYQVSIGEGASDFQYRTEPENVDEPRQRFGPRAIAIERPEDSDLPTLDEGAPERRPPDSEPREAGETGGNGTEGESGNTTATPDDETADQPEQQPENEYTLLRTTLRQPPLTDAGNLLRFLSVLVGVVAVGSGGYLRSRP